MATFVTSQDGQVGTEQNEDTFFQKEEDKYPRMTKEYLRKHCRALKLYVTPYLNDVLYLHFKGFSKIENLEEYTGLKCLWLESNGIGRIENLNNPELRCLFLQQNLIKKIENLGHLENLSQLNLSHNMIHKIEALDGLPRLETLQISHNKLEDRDSLLGLVGCDHISCLDLSHNSIDGDVVDILSGMKSLKVLYLMGNPITRTLRHYRRRLVFQITALTYLDDRPVFPRERACTQAWFDGGVEAENEERRLWISKENKKIRDSVDALSKLRKNSTAKRIENQLREEHDKEGKTGPYPVVDVDSVCWLSGDYKLVDIVENAEQTNQQEGIYQSQKENTEEGEEEKESRQPQKGETADYIEEESQQLSKENMEDEENHQPPKENIEDTEREESNQPPKEETGEDTKMEEIEVVIAQPKRETSEGIFSRRPKMTTTNMRFVVDACKNAENGDNISVLGDETDQS